jgi:hypothetical protein
MGYGILTKYDKLQVVLLACKLKQHFLCVNCCTQSVQLGQEVLTFAYFNLFADYCYTYYIICICNFVAVCRLKISKSSFNDSFHHVIKIKQSIHFRHLLIP